MRKILLSAFAFAAMTSVAMAAPVPMTDAQMDAVTAGAVAQANVATITQVNICIKCTNVTQVNVAEVNQANVNVGSTKGVGSKKGHDNRRHHKPRRHKRR